MVFTLSHQLEPESPITHKLSPLCTTRSCCSVLVRCSIIQNDDTQVSEERIRGPGTTYLPLFPNKPRKTCSGGAFSHQRDSTTSTVLGSGSTWRRHRKIAILFLNDTELPATWEDAGWSRKYLATYGGDRRRRLRVLKTLALPLSVSWSKNTTGITACWDQRQPAEDALYELVKRSVYLGVTVYSHCARQFLSWSVFGLKHSGAATPLCSLLHTSYYTIWEVNYSTISYYEYRRRLQPDQPWPDQR
jgi:hypothetical protein